MLKLVIQDDEGKTTVVPFIRDEVTIGRQEGNTIRLTERNVSRNHARILRGDASIIIEDLESYNGIRVNGSKIQGKCGLAVSDRVKIGDYLIELKKEVDEQEDPSEKEDTVKMETVNAEDVNGFSDNATATALTPVAAKKTAPLRPVSEDDATPVATPDEPTQKFEALPARLVVLSHDLPQREFSLTADGPVTIGRTAENDIIIEHRSISRHHARVALDGNRYAIEDLGSANGLHVNGEEYDRVELRRGDIVELGHVRLRFVEAGEEFAIPPVAPVEEDVVVGKKRSILPWLIVIGVVIGAVVLLVMRSKKDNEPGNIANSSASSLASSVSMLASSSTDSSLTSAMSSVATSASSSLPASIGKLARARTALENEEWAEAKRIANEVLAQEPTNDDARRLLSQATLEAGNQVLFKEIQKAIKDHRYTAIDQRFRKIPKTSRYHALARDAKEKARARAFNRVESYIDSNTKGGTCSRLRTTRFRREAAAWPRLTQTLSDGYAACRAVAANRSSKSSVSVSSSKPSSSVASSENTVTPEKLRDDIRGATQRGDFSKALRLCRKAKSGPDTFATNCTVSACNLKSKSSANRYFKMVRSESRRAYLRKICQGHDIELP